MARTISYSQMRASDNLACSEHLNHDVIEQSYYCTIVSESCPKESASLGPPDSLHGAIKISLDHFSINFTIRQNIMRNLFFTKRIVCFALVLLLVVIGN